MFRERLKDLMDKRSLNASDLARKAGVPRSNIQAWLTGASPNIEQLGKCALILEITVDELYFGTKPKSGLDHLLEELEVHNEVYRISIKKIVKKKGDT